jgi:hypothetical protein
VKPPANNASGAAEDVQPKQRDTLTSRQNQNDDKADNQQYTRNEGDPSATLPALDLVVDVGRVVLVLRPLTCGNSRGRAVATGRGAGAEERLALSIPLGIVLGHGGLLLVSQRMEGEAVWHAVLPCRKGG